jgi:hypothetical protein
MENVGSGKLAEEARKNSLREHEIGFGNARKRGTNK